MPHVMPLVYLLVGYWLPALLVREPDIRSEQRLLDVDRTLFGTDGLARFEQRAPRLLIEYLELSYLLCYAVVPAGYACLVLGGYGGVASKPILVGRAARVVHLLRTAAVAADARTARHRTASRRDAFVNQEAESGRAGPRQRAVEHVSRAVTQRRRWRRRLR